MRTYRRRPKEIEAVQFTEATAEDVERLTGGTLATKATDPEGPVLSVPRVGQSTLDVYLGDYLYRMNGSFNVMGQAAFESLYEPSE